MKKSLLTKRFNADNSLSLLSGGRVQVRFELGRHSNADDFAKGWYGDEEVRWGVPQFRLRAPSRRAAA